MGASPAARRGPAGATILIPRGQGFALARRESVEESLGLLTRHSRRRLSLAAGRRLDSPTSSTRAAAATTASTTGATSSAPRLPTAQGELEVVLGFPVVGVAEERLAVGGDRRVPQRLAPRIAALFLPLGDPVARVASVVPPLSRAAPLARGARGDRVARRRFTELSETVGGAGPVVGVA